MIALILAAPFLLALLLAVVVVARRRALARQLTRPATSRTLDPRGDAR